MSHIKKRGGFLISMLVVYALLWIGRLLALFSPSQHPSMYAGGLTFAYPFSILVFIFATAGIAGVFLWRKWGIYALGFASLSTILFDIAFFPQQVSFLGHVISLILIALMTWAVYRKWPEFQ